MEIHSGICFLCNDTRVYVVVFGYVGFIVVGVFSEDGEWVIVEFSLFDYSGSYGLNRFSSLNIGEVGGSWGS